MRIGGDIKCVPSGRFRALSPESVWKYRASAYVCWLKMVGSRFGLRGVVVKSIPASGSPQRMAASFPTSCVQQGVRYRVADDIMVVLESLRVYSKIVPGRSSGLVLVGEEADHVPDPSESPTSSRQKAKR